MHSFVVVVRKPGRSIPKPVVAFLRQADTPELGFLPEDHLFWTDALDNVAFSGWQAATDPVWMGSHWHTSEYGITAFAGRMWPKGAMWHSRESWAEQLEGHWRTHTVVDPGQQLDGIFAAVSVTKAGTGRIVTDPFSIAVLYRAETDDFVAFSTTPRLAARVTAAPNQEPDRDPLGVAWLPFLGWVVGDRTGFVSTRVLPMGSFVEFGPAYGSRVRVGNSTPWASPSELPASEREIVQLVHEDLLASMRSIAQLPASRRRADITGGKDSRLALALMLEEGVADHFTFRTSGFEHSPDSVVGKAIAERFKLAHEAELPRPVGETNSPSPQARAGYFRRRLTTNAFQTSGMFSAWEMKGAPLTTSSTLTVSGGVGEALRTNFKAYPVLATVGELRKQFHGRSQLGASSIVRPDVRSELVKILDAELLERFDAGGSTPQDLLDSFYVRHRLRRWFGTYEELGEAGRVFPLYSLIGLQAAFAIGSVKRRNDFLPFAIMRDSCPELAKMPFADAGWSDHVLTGVPDADEYRIPAVRYEGEGPAPTQWRPDRLLDNQGVAEEYLLDEPSSPLYDIIDRDAVERALRDPLNVSMAVYRQLFGALAAAVWLGHDESADRIGAPPPPRRGSGASATSC